MIVIKLVRIDSAVKPQWISRQGVLTLVSDLTDIYAVTFSKGTVIYEGPTAYQGGIYLGGKNQIFVHNPWELSGVSWKHIGKLP